MMNLEKVSWYIELTEKTKLEILMQMRIETKIDSKMVPWLKKIVGLKIVAETDGWMMSP
jgi:hypothetical protein